MRTDHRIEYLPRPRVLSHVPQILKVPVRYLRAARAEWTIAHANEQALLALRRARRPIRLEMGGGARPGANGWTIVDLRAGADLRLDLLRPLPFADGEVDAIYSSHVLEYFGHDDILRVLREWHRILRPAGQLRVALPNARIFLEAYLTNRDFDPDYYCQYKPALHYHSRIDYANYMAYMDAHRHMFDEDNLLAILAEAGFRDATLSSFDPAIDLKERAFESIYAVAFR